MTRIAVLASGSGTILASIVAHEVPIQLVLTDRECPALEIATQAGIPTLLVDRRKFGYRPGPQERWGRWGFTRAVATGLKHYAIDVVAMAGFFTILHNVIFDDFAGRILNIHPALLPAFKGASPVRDALTAGVTETGSTVHIITPMLDDERFILAQVRVPVLPDDDVDSLRERIKVRERELYPQVLKEILSGSINLEQIKEQI